MMYSAEDYIAMRGNAHRASWITVFICTLPICAAFIYVGDYILLAVTLVVGTIPALTKAYKKTPYEPVSSDGYLASGGDIGGD